MPFRNGIFILKSIMFLYFITSLVMALQNNVIVDFNNNSNLDDWYIVDDIVMGGVSNGNMKINSDGNAVFYGEISLENNGGFSSVRYRIPAKDISSYRTVVLKVKGDTKKYQFRLKDKRSRYFSYSKEFLAKNEWNEIRIDLQDLRPVFRGRQLNLPNFSSDSIEELTILFGNKKNEKFKLEIDKIYLE